MNSTTTLLLVLVTGAALIVLLACLLDFPSWRKKTTYTPSKQNQVKKFLIIAAIALFAFLISLTGCKKVDPKPCKKELTQDSIKRIFRANLKH